MKILHVTPSYYPAIDWGGPIYSTLGLCDALSSMVDVAPMANVARLTTSAIRRPLLTRTQVTEVASRDGPRPWMDAKRQEALQQEPCPTM